MAAGSVAANALRTAQANALSCAVISLFTLAATLKMPQFVYGARLSSMT